MINVIKRDNGIWEYNNVIESPEIILSDLLANSWWSDYTNTGGGETVKGRHTSIGEDSPTYSVILEAFEKNIQQYISENNVDISINNMGKGYWGVREYQPETYMTPHADIYGFVKENGNPSIPVITALLYLNDEYEGGQLSFPDDKLMIKPAKGSMIIFPSRLVHGVELISGGNRYLTATYVYDKDFSVYDKD
jgi:predicted 2-oxoglutarate/Fe(II)-dependent dioxygenase YbiX